MKWICFVCANWPLWFSTYNICIKVSVWFFLFLWNKCLEIQVLHHMVDICLVLEMMPHISRIAEPFYITIAMSGPISLHLYWNFVLLLFILSILIYAPCSHHGFNLYLPNDWWWWTSVCSSTSENFYSIKCLLIHFGFCCCCSWLLTVYYTFYMLIALVMRVKMFFSVAYTSIFK